jgi:hypothetical protein
MGADDPTPEPEVDDMVVQKGYGASSNSNNDPYSKEAKNQNKNEFTFQSPSKPTGMPDNYQKPSSRLQRIDEAGKSTQG